MAELTPSVIRELMDHDQSLTAGLSVDYYPVRFPKRVAQLGWVLLGLLAFVCGILVVVSGLTTRQVSNWAFTFFAALFVDPLVLQFVKCLLAAIPPAPEPQGADLVLGGDL